MPPIHPTLRRDGDHVLILDQTRLPHEAVFVHLRTLADKSPANMAFDGNGDYVYLAPNRVNLQMAQERFPDIKFLETREIY